MSEKDFEADLVELEDDEGGKVFVEGFPRCTLHLVDADCSLDELLYRTSFHAIAIGLCVKAGGHSEEGGAEQKQREGMRFHSCF